MHYVIEKLNGVDQTNLHTFTAVWFSLFSWRARFRPFLSLGVCVCGFFLRLVTYAHYTHSFFFSVRDQIHLFCYSTHFLNLLICNFHIVSGWCWMIEPHAACAFRLCIISISHAFERVHNCTHQIQMGRQCVNYHALHYNNFSSHFTHVHVVVLELFVSLNSFFNVVCDVMWSWFVFSSIYIADI